MLPAVGLDRGHVHIINEPEFQSSRPPLQQGLGPHLSEIAVFTPAQTNRIKVVNVPGFDSTELNKAGVKMP